MEQALTLIANESFGELSCNFYQQSGTDDILLTREQIGMALEYADPRIAIRIIHSRHRERLDRFSVRIFVDKEGGPVWSLLLKVRGGYQIDYPLPKVLLAGKKRGDQFDPPLLKALLASNKGVSN